MYERYHNIIEWRVYEPVKKSVIQVYTYLEVKSRT